MRSFTFALIAAAFATLISAAPVASPAGLPVNGLPSLSNTVDVVGTLKGLLKGKTDLLTEGVRARTIPVVNDLPVPKLPELGTRGDMPSLGFIINEVSTGVHASVEQLQSSDVTHIQVTVAVIKGYIDAAIPQVKALVGDEKDAIMVSVDGQVLTVDDVAKLLASILKPILLAVGALLKVVDADVKALLADIIIDVFVLVGGIIRLVDGLADALGPLIIDVGDVIVALGVDISQYGLTC